MWLGFTLASLILTGGTTGAETKKADQAPTKTAHAQNGTAKLTVHYPATFYIAAPKPVRIVVENTGDKNLIFLAPEVRDGFLFAVLDESGNAVPRTRYGKTLPTEPRNWGDRGKVGRVSPGEKFEMELDPMRAFDMTMPGSYKLDITVESAFYVRIPGDNLSGSYTVDSDFSLKGIRLDVKEGPLPGAK